MVKDSRFPTRAPQQWGESTILLADVCSNCPNKCESIKPSYSCSQSPVSQPQSYHSPCPAQRAGNPLNPCTRLAPLFPASHVEIAQPQAANTLCLILYTPSGPVVTGTGNSGPAIPSCSGGKYFRDFSYCTIDRGLSWCSQQISLIPTALNVRLTPLALTCRIMTGTQHHWRTWSSYKLLS